MYIMAAMAVVAIAGQHKKAGDQTKAGIENSRLQLAKYKQARQRASDNHAAKKESLIAEASRVEVNIERNKIAAEAQFDSTFAGGGISGDSIDTLSNQIDTEVAQNKFRNKANLEKNLSNAGKTFDNESKDLSEGASGIAEDITHNTFSASLAAGISGAQQGQAIEGAVGDVNFSGFNNKPKPTKGGGQTDLNFTSGLSSNMRIS